MSEDSCGENPFKAAPRRWSWRRKAIAIALVVFVTGFGAIAWKLGPYFYWRYSAQQRVNAEIARLKAAGEPLTAAELHAQYKVPDGTPDLTAEWSKALAELNAVVPTVQDPEFQDLPLKHSRPLEDLEPTAANSCLAQTEAFLVRIDPQLESLLEVAPKKGQVRYHVKFEDHLAALLVDAVNASTAARVLTIRARVNQIRGNAKELERSIGAQIATLHTLDHSRTFIEQLTRCAMSHLICDALISAANHEALSREQLRCLGAQLDTIEFRRAAWNAYSGERVMGWEAMDENASLVADDAGGLTTLITSAGPVDRAFFLDTIGRAVNASEREYSRAAQEFESIDADFEQLRLLPPLERMHYLYSAMLVPAPCGAHVAFYNADARCKLTQAALAAHEFRQERGHWPVNVKELSVAAPPPDCFDPFTGSELVLCEEGEDLVIYSVGSDQIDDGGVEENSRFNPDVVVRVERPR